MGSILAIVERAYHGTIEEQDDTILWFSAAVKNAGADLAVLLRGNAVSYALQGQDASGLTIGGVPLKVPPTIDKDVTELIGKGVPVYAVDEDLKRRGIAKADLVPGVKVIPQKETIGLWERYDSIWHW
jgi:sulfur transfer complex TusBCD TusB component (DsrH family)